MGRKGRESNQRSQLQHVADRTERGKWICLPYEASEVVDAVIDARNESEDDDEDEDVEDEEES